MSKTKFYNSVILQLNGFWTCASAVHAPEQTLLLAKWFTKLEVPGVSFQESGQLRAHPTRAVQPLALHPGRWI